MKSSANVHLFTQNLLWSTSTSLSVTTLLWNVTTINKNSHFLHIAYSWCSLSTWNVFLNYISLSSLDLVYMRMSSMILWRRNQGTNEKTLFIMSIFNMKKSLRDIFSPHYKMIVSWPKVYLGKKIWTLELVKQVIDSTKRILVICSDGIELSIIDKYSKGSIFFLNEQH